MPYSETNASEATMLEKNNVLLGRRDVLRAGAAAVAALGVAPMTKAEGVASQRRPNVVLLHCHDLGTYLHCYGAKTVQSPNLDAFASQGVRFANSFCTAPQCSPSRASIFTGRYPHNNGVMGLAHAEFAWDLYPDELHLAQLLKRAGYATEAVGIIHETHSGPNRCGYDHYTGGSRASDMATAAIERLKHLAQNTDQPFLLCAGCIEPHRLGGRHDADYMGFLSDEFEADSELGVDVPGFLRDTPGTRTELAELQGAVRHMDRQMGRVLDAIRELGIEDNTLVIFTTDHGYAMPRAKCSLYDPGLAVLTIFRLPMREGWHGGITRNEMISNIDYVPTILDLVGIPVPENVQGRSLAPLLDGDDYTPRDVIFGEISHHDYYDPRRCIRTATHKLIVNFSSAPFFMDPSQSWRPRSVTVVPEDPARAYHACCELYDLENDPWELKNLAEAPEHAEIRDALMVPLRDHLVTTQDPILEGAITPPQHRKSLEILGQGHPIAG